MIAILARRNLTLRPWRSVLLLGGFGNGVGVMIVLLAIGDAMLTQSRDERLVGGGDITVLPEGIDVEVMKTGGVGGLFFSISNARFLDLQLLSSRRNARAVKAVAPQIVDKLLYLRTPDGRERPVRATGELPSRSALVGALPALGTGAWVDDSLDRRWATPTPAQLRADIDHFHLTPRDADHRDSWGEWHYFNLLSNDGKRWAFLSFILGGAVPDGQWGGQILLTLHEAGKPARRFTATFPKDSVELSTWNANLRIGNGTVTVDDSGRYVVHARARSYTLQCGRVHPPDSANGDTPLFFYQVDSLCFRT
jgi:hypothetical protein